MDSETEEGGFDSAVRRAEMYGFLARALRRPAAGDDDWLGPGLMDAWLQTARCSLGNELEPDTESLRLSCDTSTWEERGREFHRLFDSHGPMEAPPYETEYLKDWPQQALIQPAILADIQGFYKAFGLAISPGFAERCDHIRLEVEFLHFLALKEVIALNAGEEEHLEVVRNAQRRFLEDHASRWAAKFSARLAECKALPVYASLGRLIELWVEEDMRARGCFVLPCGAAAETHVEEAGTP